jgi:hypothetical protein
MSESSSSVVAWTAIAAIVISLSSAGYAIFRAAQGPDLRAFPVEDMMVFAYRDGPAQGQLASIAMFDLANTSPDYPDILVSQVIRVMKGAAQVACISERGEVTQADVVEPPDAISASGPAVAETPTSAAAAVPPVPAPPVLVPGGVVETFRLHGLLIGVLDTPSRAELQAGSLFSRRQLFDQRATASVVDPCYEAGASERYTIDQLVADFAVGDVVDFRYEARFSESNAWVVSCGVEMTQRRAELLKTRGHINAPCKYSVAEPASDVAPLEGFFRFLNRVF